MADFDATRLVMSRSDESRGDYWKDRALSAEAQRDALLKLLDDTPVGSEFRSDWEQWLKRRDAARESK